MQQATTDIKPTPASGPAGTPGTAGSAVGAAVETVLNRGLNVRHIRFMALGSAIGTGLFYGSASAIQKAGPAVLLAYMIGGAAVFMVMRALGVEEFGVYGYVVSLIGLATFGANLGMDRLINRDIAQDPERADRLVATGMAATGLLSLLTGALIGEGNFEAREYTSYAQGETLRGQVNAAFIGAQVGTGLAVSMAGTGLLLRVEW